MKTTTTPTCRLCGSAASPENPVDFQSDACARCIEADESESESEPSPFLNAAEVMRLPEWRREGYCCAKAVRVFCVCIVSTNCPDHGSRCRGSHD